MTESRRRRRSRFSRRTLRNLAIGLAALSLLQYAVTGSVSWPGWLWQRGVATVSEQLSRPQGGWKIAAGKVEELGAAREGVPLPDFDLTGRVVRVADGDTVSVLDAANRQHKIRLYGIDAPERDQPRGGASREALADLVAGRTVGVVVVATDDYGRDVGTLYLDGQDINLAMVAGGHAWWYRHYAPYEHRLEAAQGEARTKRRGLWADPDPKPPWDWRREQLRQRP